MIFNNSYFEEEIREGFFIPGMIKRSWATQLDVLDNISLVCEKNEIKWFADCGTLLGAIRHHGFIPWDDDLDICMLKDDYDKFTKVAYKELPDSYHLLDIYKEKDYAKFLSRVINHKTIDVSSDFLKQNHGFPYVSGVDVFPLHYLFNDDEKEEERRTRTKKVWDLIEEYISAEKKDSEKLIAEVERGSGYKVDKTLPLENAMYRILDQMFSEADSLNAKYVALMPFWVKNQDHKYPIELFRYSLSIPFEETTIRVPAEYEKVLDIEYRNWQMAFRSGGIHEYPFYSEQERILASKYNNRIPYKYSFEKKEDITEANETDDPINKIFKTLHDVSGMVQNLYMSGDYTSIISLLEGSQDLAIQIGNHVETEYAGKCHELVKKLEEYCEELYKIGEMLSENESADIASLDKNLNTLLDEASTIYKNELKRGKDVLFVVSRASEWKYAENIYEDRVNKGFNSSVMVIPYYEKDSTGSVTNIEHYELEAFPQSLRFEDYKTCELEKYRFSEIVILNPFDNYGSASVVHPYFYSCILKKYAEKLTYIQSFETDDIGERDEKSILNIQSLIVSPGVINSDTVYVPNESIRDLYVKILEEVTDETKEKIEGKIVVVSNYLKEKEMKTGNKTILFYTSTASFFEEPGAFNKIEKVMRLFKDKSDKIYVIWIVDEDFLDVLKEYFKEDYEKVEKIISDFENSNIGRFVQTSNPIEFINESDAYYGSRGFAMNLAMRKKIPVMAWDMNV